MDKFFSKSATDVLHHFNVTKEGLSTEQVNKSREENGFNELTEKKEKECISCFLRTIQRPFSRDINSSCTYFYGYRRC